MDSTGELGRTALDEHFEDLNEALTRIEDSDLQESMRKSKWTVKEAKHSGNVVDPDGHSLVPNKTQGLLQMKEHKANRQVCRSLEGANVHRKSEKTSHSLAPLTASTRNKLLD